MGCVKMTSGGPAAAVNGQEADRARGGYISVETYWWNSASYFIVGDSYEVQYGAHYQT